MKSGPIYLCPTWCPVIVVGGDSVVLGDVNLEERKEKYSEQRTIFETYCMKIKVEILFLVQTRSLFMVSIRKEVC